MINAKIKRDWNSKTSVLNPCQEIERKYMPPRLRVSVSMKELQVDQSQQRGWENHGFSV